MSSRNLSKRGSALLLTVLAVSLLLVMVLTLVAMVRMELRSVLNHHNLMQARAQARLAVELAVARLQETAGVDRRITLPAKADREISALVLPENRHWTRVRDAASYLWDSNNVAVLNTDFRRPIGWMISRHRDGSVPDPTDFFPYVISNGVVTVTNAALLVGPGSTLAVDRNGNQVPDDFVAAPVEESHNMTGAVIGEFAWVALEEGSKARINLTDAFRQADTNGYALAMSQRGAVESMINSFQPDNHDHQYVMSKVFSPAQLTLLDRHLGDPAPQVAEAFFHDLTLVSRGLPVNVRDGGLKRDLTAVAMDVVDNFAGELATAAASPSSQFAKLLEFQEGKLARQRALQAQIVGQGGNPAAAGLAQRTEQFDSVFRTKIHPPSTDMELARDNGGPSWSQLISFMLTGHRANSGIDPDGQLFVQAGATDENTHHLNPVILRWQVSQYYTMTAENGNWILRQHFMPALALWNPHNVRLKTPEMYFNTDYTLMRDGFSLFLKIRNPNWRGGRSAWMPAYQTWWGSRSGVNSFSFNLKIPATVFEPGQALWFELGEHHRMPYADGTSGNAGGFSAIGLHSDIWSNQRAKFPELTDGWVPVGEFDTPTNEDRGYVPMVRGLENGGGFSLYFEENLTWKTRMEAAGLLPPRRVNKDTWELITDYSLAPLHTIDNTPFIVPALPQGRERWNGSTWVNPSRSNPVYPPTFSYATVDNPTNVVTLTFPQETQAGATYYVRTKLNVFTPMDLTPGSSGDGSRNNGEITTRWLMREDGDYDSGDLLLPVSYNEHGIITNFPVNPLCIDLTGVNTDWEVERAVFAGMSDNTGAAYPRGRVTLVNGGSNIGTDMIIATTPGGIANPNLPVTAAVDFEVAVPSSLQSVDPHNAAGRFPQIDGPLPTFQAASPFLSNRPRYPVSGFVFSQRMPMHGLPAYDSQSGWALAQIPWISHFNPRAGIFGTDAANKQAAGSYPVGFRMPPGYVGGFFLNGDPNLLPTSPDELHANVGYSPNSSIPTDANGVLRAVVADVPRAVDAFAGIGQFMHGNFVAMQSPHPNANANRQFNFNGVVERRISPADQRSAYAVGSSWAEISLSPDQTFRSFWATNPFFLGPDGTTLDIEKVKTYAGSTWSDDYDLSGAKSLDGVGIRNRAFNPSIGEISSAIPITLHTTVDEAWYWNHALWDDFFMTGQANGRLRWEAGIPQRDFDLSASRSWIEGAFNLHSVSVPAWASLLASFTDLDVQNQLNRTELHDTTERIPVTRTLHPLSAAFSTEGAGDNFTNASLYEGYRRLTLEEIWDTKGTEDPADDTGLAVSIVDVIRERGPFYSLSEFVNRSLISAGDDPGVQRLMGPLQEAIERSGINGDGVGFSTLESESQIENDDFVSDEPTRWKSHHLPAVVGRAANADAPALITQADLLAKLGPVITLRSDTFRIRAYGSRLVNPNTQERARAWCEAVVVRSADYVDAVDTPEAVQNQLAPVNQLFGRRFDIVSFRWLGQDEL